MTQAIAGVTPATVQEVTVMSVWPTLAATIGGRWWGRRYMNPIGFHVLGIPITVGRILALVSIPLILPPYFLMLAPYLARRYRLTNRRVIVEGVFPPTEDRSVALDRFDNIEVEVLPGQEWYLAGDLIFRLGKVETFRIQGVSRPETFMHTCMKAHTSSVGIQQARDAGVAV